MHETEICKYPIRLFRFYNNLICVQSTMPHKGASTQRHNQQVLVKPCHNPSDRDQQAREKLQHIVKIRSRAYIQLGEETLKTVHRTFQPGVPVILHLPALTDGSLSSKSTSIPTLFVIQEGLNCLEMTDYFFTNIEPAPIIVERQAAHQNKSTSQQPVNGDRVSQQTHPQQPQETRIPPSMLTNRQVPVLNLTETNITSHADLQDTFNSLCVCSHGGREDTQDQNTVTNYPIAIHQTKRQICDSVHQKKKETMG